MKAVTKLPSYTVTCAIAQVVGELQSLGQTVTTADIAAFLQCSKPTAIKYLKKAQFARKVDMMPRKYRSNAIIYHLELSDSGLTKFNSPDWLAAKQSVYAARGILL